MYARRIFAAITMDVLYGILVNGPDDKYILRGEESNDKFSEMKIPGAFLADSIPIMQYIPAWCPGGTAQRFASEHRKLSAALRLEPFDVAKRDLVCGVFVL